MARVTIIWNEAGQRCVHTAPTHSRFDNVGFGVRFYPAELPLITLQVIDDRVLNAKTKEDIGSYDDIKRVVTIEREL